MDDRSCRIGALIGGGRAPILVARPCRTRPTPFVAHNEVWKGDREHISNMILGERYKQLVTATIKESDALKSLQHKIALEELERAAKSESDDLF